jgi:hypothetical protein
VIGPVDRFARASTNDSSRTSKSSLNPDEQPEREAMMDSELEHLLMTYSDHEVISQQGSLRDFLTCLRSLAAELQLSFEEALTESDTAYQDRLRQAFDPCL